MRAEYDFSKAVKNSYLRKWVPMNNTLAVASTIEGRLFWLEQGLAKNHIQDVHSADALIVPEKNFRDGVPFVFHQDTTTLYRFLKTQLHGQVSIEVCADDDEFLEISLHSASFRLSKIVASYVAAPLIVGVLTNYLYDYMKAKPTDSVEASLIVEDHECRAFKFDFKGEAKDFNLLADKVGELARNCEAATGGKKAKTKK